jgi:hypothetical protein
MKKIALLVLAGVLVTVMPLVAELVYTSEGYYQASIDYIGKYRGQEFANTTLSNLPKMYTNVRIGIDNVKLSKGQRELVYELLSRYETSKGDTFGICFSSNFAYDAYFLVCEYISATEYTYWIRYGMGRK